MSPRLVSLAAALIAAVSAWLSLGIVAVTADHGTAARVGVLPPVWMLVLFLAGAAGASVLWRPQPARTLPLFVTLVLWLPWLPGPIPPAFVLWTGPVVWFVWIGVAVAFLAAAPSSIRIPACPWLVQSGKGPVVAAIIALAVYLAAAARMSYRLPGGDEPHYLVIAQSLLYDGDLQIENNHQRGDYKPYFRGELRPDYLRRGQNGQIYSVHAPGLAALSVPAFAVAGYPGVVVFLALVSAAGAGLAWRVSFEVTASAAAAWFAWASITLTAPFLFHAFTVYPDGMASILVLVGVWSLLQLRADGPDRNADGRVRFLIAGGAAMALLPWLHTRYAVLAATSGLLVLARLAGRPGFLRGAATFFALPVASALAWFSYFYFIWGRFNPAIQYGGYRGSLDYVASGLLGLFFDQQFGIVPNSPVYIVSLAGVVALLVGRPAAEGLSKPSGGRRLGVELLLIALPYLASTTSYRMWWGGYSAPARFVVPVALMLCIPAAAFWASARARVTHALAIVGLGASLAIAATMVTVERGFLAFNDRDGFSLWLEWINRTSDLPLGLPSLHRDPTAIVLRDVGYWVLALVLALCLLYGVGRKLKSRGAVLTLTLAVCGAVSMAALEAVWRAHGSNGTTATASQLDLLRGFRPAIRPVGVQYTPTRVLETSQVAGSMRLFPSDRVGRRLVSRNKPLMLFPLVPAGLYRLHIETSDRSGEIVVRVGRTTFNVDRVPLSTLPAGGGSIEVQFPVEVHSLQVFADEAGSRAVRNLWLVPTAVWPNDLPLARRAARYGETRVFFLDERIFEERRGFWIPGESEARVVMARDGPVRAARMLMRNGSVENEVNLSSGIWRADLKLEAGEERMMELPFDPELHGAFLQIRSASGFRPVDVDPNSRDRRFLGVWIEPK